MSHSHVDALCFLEFQHELTNTHTHTQIRDMFDQSVQSDIQSNSDLFGSFDPEDVFNRTINSNMNPVDVVNPLMSSLYCFQNSTEYFPNGFEVIQTVFFLSFKLKSMLYN